MLAVAAVLLLEEDRVVWSGKSTCCAAAPWCLAFRLAGTAGTGVGRGGRDPQRYLRGLSPNAAAAAMSKKNSKAARRKRHEHAMNKEKTDTAKRAEVRDRKAANRVRRMSSIMAEESDRAQMEAAARAVPEDASLMPPPPALAASAVRSAAPAAAVAAPGGPKLMKKPVKRKVLKAPGANLLLATFTQGLEADTDMETEGQQPVPRERKMSKSFQVALRYDVAKHNSGPNKAIRKRAKGPKAIAAITSRLQRAKAKRAKAMALE